MMKFEFDPDKSRSNNDKHGIDFEEAQELWKDGELSVIQAKSPGEVLFMAIGIISRQHWSAVYTLRDNALRLISVRRSRPKEIVIYEDARKDN